MKSVEWLTRNRLHNINVTVYKMNHKNTILQSYNKFRLQFDYMLCIIIIILIFLAH